MAAKTLMPGGPVLFRSGAFAGQFMVLQDIQKNNFIFLTDVFGKSPVVKWSINNVEPA